MFLRDKAKATAIFNIRKIKLKVKVNSIIKIAFAVPQKFSKWQLLFLTQKQLKQSQTFIQKPPKNKKYYYFS